MILSFIGFLGLSCINSKKYKENLNTKTKIVKPVVTAKPEDVIEVVETKKTTYQNINYLSEKIDIYNDSLLDKNIIKKIKSYYYKEYAKEWKKLLKEYENFVKRPPYETENDSIAYLGFLYAEDESEDPIVVGMIHCLIPTKQGIKLYMSSPILYTDLNNDRVNDLIVVAHTEGGWRGGNVFNQDIFVFLNEKGSYKLASVTTDWELAKPKGYGYVRVNNAENGILLAEADIYTDKDARCCPSDHYFMKYKFEDNKFVIVSSEFIGSE